MRDLLVALSARPDLGKFWSNPTGAMARDNGAWQRYGYPGSSDILGVLKDGTIACIECKTGSATQSKLQKLFQGMIQEYGGFYMVARDIENTLKALETKCNPS